MRATGFAQAIAVAALAALASTMAAAQPSKLGQREYRNSSAVCHGASAKGDGSYGTIIEQKMPDLSLLFSNNSGVFPVERIYETIEGSNMPRSHGMRDRPIWGGRHRIQAAKHDLDVPHDKTARSRGRGYSH